MSMTQKGDVVRTKCNKYSSHLQIYCYDVKQTQWALRLSLLYVMS